MADYYIKIVPKDYSTRLSETVLKKAQEYLVTNVLCESVEISSYETPIFIDCGSNLTRISCPQCGAEIDFEWWGDAMDKAYETQFASLGVELPCCHNCTTLDNLNYDYPCAFAICAITIKNPIVDIENCIIDCVQKVLRVEIRRIDVHM